MRVGSLTPAFAASALEASSAGLHARSAFAARPPPRPRWRTNPARSVAGRRAGIPFLPASSLKRKRNAPDHGLPSTYLSSRRTA